jgi:Glycosyl transferases group 1
MWTIHRALTDRINLHLPFLANSLPRVLALSVQDEISHAQLFPYFENADKLNIQIRELPIDSFLSGKTAYKRRVDSIYLQTWFDFTDERMNALLDAIEDAWPSAPITYFDWFAPTDLRYAKVLAPRIKSYVKKQILSDFSRYGQPTLGDTNLSNYYARRFNLSMATVQFEIPQHFKKKIVLGPGFEFSPRILELLEGPLSDHRPIDLHARITTIGTDWYAAMREEAKKAVDALPTSIAVAKNGRVSQKRFFQELKESKLCFSPFGYGEVCWRDFEAMSTGAVLVKPDMSHHRLAHDFFVPGETYIPVKWDLSNLSETVERLLASPTELQRISKNAYDLLRSTTKAISLP